MLSSTPKPDFTDHFPRIGRGHGRMKKPRHPRTPPCAEKGCRMAAGHAPGRAHNALDWEDEVQYSGPWSGLAREEKKEKRREDGVHHPSKNCHDRCQIRGRFTHSICLLPGEQRASVLAQMLVKIDLLRETKQGSRILGEYAGVEARLPKENAA